MFEWEWFSEQIFFKKGRENTPLEKNFFQQKGDNVMSTTIVMKIIMSVLDGIFALLLVAFMNKSKEKNTRVGFFVMLMGLIANIILMNVR